MSRSRIIDLTLVRSNSLMLVAGVRVPALGPGDRISNLLREARSPIDPVRYELFRGVVRYGGDQTDDFGARGV